MGCITTVTGNISREELGITLAHEHIYCDISPHSGKSDNILTDEDSAVREMVRYRTAGGDAIVEMTPEGLARNPAALRRISEASGVRIISGIAFYDESMLPDWVLSASEKEITTFLINELETGTEGVKAGLIGELATRNDPNTTAETYRLSEIERRIFQAAAAAQKETGAAISTHASVGRGGAAQLRILEKAGADLHKVAIGHCDTQWNSDVEKDITYYTAILETGAYCEFDLIGWDELMPDDARADRITILVHDGHIDQLLLGTDTCRRSQLAVNDGRGYDFLFREFVPRLLARGVTPEQIDRMLIANPARLLERV